jgi:hypothetical protein
MRLANSRKIRCWRCSSGALAGRVRDRQNVTSPSARTAEQRHCASPRKPTRSSVCCRCEQSFVKALFPSLIRGHRFARAGGRKDKQLDVRVALQPQSLPLGERIVLHPGYAALGQCGRGGDRWRGSACDGGWKRADWRKCFARQSDRCAC